MKVAHREIAIKSKEQAKGEGFHKKQTSSIHVESASSLLKQMNDSKNLKNQSRALLGIIENCYDNLQQQRKLAHSLDIPFISGPISLHSIPSAILNRNEIMKNDDEDEPEVTQLEFLFGYLKSLKEYYFCWIIYYSKQAKGLNVKLIKREEVKQQMQLFNVEENLVGIFLNRRKATPIACIKEIPIRKGDDEQREFYGKGRCQTKIHAKSTNSLNNSTGSTFKPNFHKDYCIEDSHQIEGDFKKLKIKLRSISPKFKFLSPNKETKGISFIKKQPSSTKFTKQGQKNPSLLSRAQLKSKSKSNTSLVRSKSIKMKEAQYHPAKLTKQFLKEAVGTGVKSKLRKQNKVKKIESIYFKRNNQPNH